MAPSDAAPSNPSSNSARRRLVVGVVRHQPDAVVLEAARFAARLGADLVCASVDVGRYIVQEHPDGTVTSAPVDPDLPELGEAVFDPEIEARLRELLGGPADDTGTADSTEDGTPPRVSWSTRALVGDPAHALGRLADALDAEAIVVGTRDTGIRAGIQEFFSGSVAVHLAHRQHRPVIVIPLTPVDGEGTLPWEDQL
jgi:nucleotide-binding universal stress UspA family protein